jgi:hypothetical protein
VKRIDRTMVLGKALKINFEGRRHIGLSIKMAQPGIRRCQE